MFEGLRILELRRGLEPGYAGRWFALYGATVHVVEVPGSLPVGEYLPRLSKGGGGSALARYLDVKKVSGSLDSFAGSAYDVVVSDLSFEALEEMLKGTSVVTASTLKCVVGPFGSQAMGSQRDGSTLTTYALSGLMAMNGYPDREPLSVWGYQFEHLAGLQAFSAIVATLRLPMEQRAKQIEISGYEVAVSVDCAGVPAWSYAQRLRAQPGRNIGQSHPVTPLRCIDGSVFLNCATQDQWVRLTILIGQPELQDDPRFAGPPVRKLHADLVDSLLEPWFASQTVEGAIEQCQLWRIPCAPFRELPAARASKHLEDRGFFSFEIDGTAIPFARSAMPDCVPVTETGGV